MRKSTVRKKICLPDFLSSCRTDLFLELVMSGDWQSCRTVLDLRASNFRGLIVLRTLIFRGLLYSPGTFLLPLQSCGPVFPGIYSLADSKLFMIICLVSPAQRALDQWGASLQCYVFVWANESIVVINLRY